MADRPLELAQFLKLKRVAASGGEAKVLVQQGQITVNGAVETRRGRKLQPGDVVEVAGRKFVVEASK